MVAQVDTYGVGSYGRPRLSDERGNGEVSLDDVPEGADSVGIKLDASPAIQLLECLPEGTPSSVGPIAGNSVKGV